MGDDDRRALQRISGRRSIEVISNGVRPLLTDALPDRTPTVAFTGVLSYQPNVDAVLWFVKSVWPRIRGAVPDCRLLVAGRRPAAAIMALSGHHGIEVLPDVPDINAILGRAWVVVAPMRTGAGVKNKVLEAWAASRPVVMTPLAANGLHMDEALLAYVTPDAPRLAGMVVSLLRDQLGRQRLGALGLALVQQHHEWRQQAGKFDALARSLVPARVAQELRVGQGRTG